MRSKTSCVSVFEGDLAALLSGLQGAQYENRLLAFLKRECRMDALAVAGERNGTRQSQAQDGRLKDGAMFFDRYAMRHTRIIEGRTASHSKGQRSPRDSDAPNQLILPGRFARQADRHEIFEFADAVRREKASDQHIGFRPIELFRPNAFPLGRDLEPASLLVVQDGGEHAR